MNLINIAKRELERERELLMSKSLPGMPEESHERSSQEDGSDSDSDTESDDKTTELQAEINDIQSDIEIKTKLIEQLELSQQRMTVRFNKMQLFDIFEEESWQNQKLLTGKFKP